jgi:fumarylpyruvate hydrolase
LAASHKLTIFPVQDVNMFVFEPTKTVSLPIQGSDLQFPVNRIFCIGRNYAAHAIEMGVTPDTRPPLYFQKSNDCLETTGSFPYPTQSTDVQHEVELVVGLKSGGVNLTLDTAKETVFGYAIGLDMTRRDLQREAKSRSHPWESSKSFPYAAPMGPIHRREDVGQLSSGAITLQVNGKSRQSGDLNQMIWSIPALIVHLSTLTNLAAGDLIMTGTPSGVGPIFVGDTIVASIDGLGCIQVVVVN